MRPEHISDEHELVFAADRTRRARFFAEVACRTHEFGMRIAHLVLTKATSSILVDEVLARETMVDGPATTQRTRTETHAPKASDRISPVRNGALGTLGT